MFQLLKCFDFVDIAVIAVNNGIITYYNENAAVHLGLSDKDYFKKHPAELLPGIDTELEKPQTIYTDIGVFLVTPKKLSEMNMEGVTLLTINNITEAYKDKKRAQELCDRCNGMEIALNSLTDEIFIANGKGVTEYVNNAVERIYGIKPSEIIGRHVSELAEKKLFNPSATMRVIEERRRVTITQETSKGNILVATSNPVFDSEGNLTHIVTTARDMTEMSSLNCRLEEAEKLIDAYQSTISSLRGKTIASQHMVVSGNEMETLMKTLENVALVTTTVLISGESGVGKSVAARHIHDISSRKDKPFVVINCGSIPENLIESELFGHMEGSFTGATRGGKAGLIELADGGTVFLDEVGDLPLNIQVKLLHMIQEKKLIRVGGQDYIDVDIRIIAATNRDLADMVEKGLFREDLFYRLSVVPIVIPPLRERKDEIEELAWKFISYYNSKYEYQKELAPDLLNFFRCYEWPGNIRELENIIERLVVTVPGNMITKNDLPAGIFQVDENHSAPLVVNKLMDMKEASAEVERQLLMLALEKNESTYKIAEMLGINQSTVVRKMKAYNLKSGRKRSG